MTQRLADKVCLVTGAGSGIGRSTSELFAREGGVVVALDLDLAAAEATAASLREGGAEASAFECDVGDAPAIGSAVAAVGETYGRIDVLVNNAGYGVAGSVLETSEETWARLLQVDLTGVFLVSRAVLPVMIDGGRGGAIVNVSSAAAIIGIADRAAYCAAKGGVAALTRAMAIDHSRDNVRVNAVCPGSVESPYYEQMLAAADDREAMLAGLRSRQILGRLGMPEEIAQGILFLASSDGSFCTGALLAVDGGMTAW